MKKKVWIGVAAAIAVLVIVIGVIVVVKNGTGNDGDTLESVQPNKVGNAIVGEGTVDTGADRYKDSSPMEDYRDGGYIVNMWETTWHFEDGASPAYDVSITNDPDNLEAVYLELMLAESRDVLFVSDYLEPGESLHGVELGEELEKGEYDCILVYHLMDQDKEQETGTVTLAITVIVEN